MLPGKGVSLLVQFAVQCLQHFSVTHCSLHICIYNSFSLSLYIYIHIYTVYTYHSFTIWLLEAWCSEFDLYSACAAIAICYCARPKSRRQRPYISTRQPRHWNTGFGKNSRWTLDMCGKLKRAHHRFVLTHADVPILQALNYLHPWIP